MRHSIVISFINYTTHFFTEKSHYRQKKSMSFFKKDHECDFPFNIRCICSRSVVLLYFDLNYLWGFSFPLAFSLLHIYTHTEQNSISYTRWPQNLKLLLKPTQHHVLKQCICMQCMLYTDHRQASVDLLLAEIGWHCLSPFLTQSHFPAYNRKMTCFSWILVP